MTKCQQLVHDIFYQQSSQELRNKGIRKLSLMSDLNNLKSTILVGIGETEVNQLQRSAKVN